MDIINMDLNNMDIINMDINMIMLELSEENPGANRVVSKLFEIIEKDQTKNEFIINIMNKLIIKHITGVRLWYIYKNEAKMNIHNLVNLDFDIFTHEYFMKNLKKIF